MTSQPQTRGIPSVRAWTTAEWGLAGLLLVLAAVAWLVTTGVAMPAMTMGILTGMGAMEADRPGPFALGLFLVTWVVMMAAMMLPAITPFTVGVSRLVRARPHPHGVLTWLTVGYLLVWGATGVAAYAVLRGFETLAGDGGVAAVRAGAGVLLAAGIYQFTPLKQWCLLRCRSPLALVMTYGNRVAAHRRGAVEVGVVHGAYCLGCCWALMAVLLAAGVMNLAWMVTVAAAITVEKVAPRGRTVSYVLGAVLVALGATLLAAPTLIAPPM